MRARPWQFAGQAVLYGAFVGLVGYFSTLPDYEHVAPGNAVIKLSFSHAGARIVECRRLTVEEIAALPPQERRPIEKCPRARAPLFVEMSVDGNLLYQRAVPASGLANDGEAHVYVWFEVAAGAHAFVVRMRDTARADGFDYEYQTAAELSPGQNFVVDFDAASGGFRIL